jgi:hypothetical protein
VAGKNDHVRYLPVLGSTQYVLCRDRPGRENSPFGLP